MSGGAPFLRLLRDARLRSRSALCVGLDPDPALMPRGMSGVAGLRDFVREIVSATSDLVCAYKPNLAFFERYGAAGWEVLAELMEFIPREIPVIADAKRGDIGNTSAAYAEAFFDKLGAAALTANPYLGVDALEPMLDDPRGYTFILCRTSNPGAAQIQDLEIAGEPLYAHVLRLFQPWLQQGKAGLVIGAQEAAAFKWAAHLAPNACILVPGVGAQGGSAADLAASLAPRQRSAVVVSASRSVIHAGRDADFARAARAAAEHLRGTLSAALEED